MKPPSKHRKMTLKDIEVEQEMDPDSAVEAVDLLKDLLDGWDDSWCQDEEKQTDCRSRRVRATDDMAQRIMDVLCENGQGDFLLLRDDEIREWWQSVTAERDRKRRQLEAKQRREELRKSGLSKLTAAERRALGIK